MKKLGVALAFVLAVFAIFYFIKNFNDKEKIVSPIVKEKEKPLEKYAFANLRKIKFPISTITLSEILDQKENYISQIFHYGVQNPPAKSDLAPAGVKKVSGLISVPKEEGTYPIIIMLRGFVPKEIYATGIGTKRAGEVFAQNGFIVLAPDFLGYGQSDSPSASSIEERLQTYTTILSLLSSLDSLSSGLTASYSGKINADISKVGLWGHSNGGQIALSILEITGKNYPTVLWAPVSKPFPYSILYFTDEFDDHGKALRKMVANFETDYNVELYSPTNFYSWINAPIQLHQGEKDDAVPLKWSDQLVEDLTKLGKEVTYFTYPGVDHNLLPDGWSTAVQRSLDFYKTKLQ